MKGLSLAEIKALTQEQCNLAATGHCPFCERYITGWESPSGFLAPEMWESLRERGIDPGSGHTKNCRRKEIAIP